MAKKSKQIKKESNTRDQYTAVLEDLRSQFGVFGESLQFVRDDMVGVKQTLNSHTEMIGRLTVDMVEVKQTLNSHGEILNSHTEMIGQLMIDMAEVKNGLKTKVSQDDFARLEKRPVR